MNGDVRFLTLKGCDKKHQKIGYVNDKCRKISKTYVIIRERNKKTDGYHFHALLKVIKQPPPSWFTKGVHINLQTVGRRHFRSIHDLTKKDIFEYSDVCPVEELKAQYLLDKVDNKINVVVKRDTDIDRVLSYMAKEMEFPAQYTDYILSIRGKMMTLGQPVSPQEALSTDTPRGGFT